MDAGLVGGLVGGAIGVAGGAFGTWASIRNTSGPRERTLIVRAALVTWILVAAMLAGLLLLPPPWSAAVWIPYGIALPLGIRWINRRQREIRADEAAAAHGRR